MSTLVKRLDECYVIYQSSASESGAGAGLSKEKGAIAQEFFPDLVFVTNSCFFLEKDPDEVAEI